MRIGHPSHEDREAVDIFQDANRLKEGDRARWLGEGKADMEML
jgi:hypothetical protein